MKWKGFWYVILLYQKDAHDAHSRAIFHHNLQRAVKMPRKIRHNASESMRKGNLWDNWLWFLLRDFISYRDEQKNESDEHKMRTSGTNQYELSDSDSLSTTTFQMTFKKELISFPAVTNALQWTTKTIYNFIYCWLLNKFAIACFFAIIIQYNLT